MSKPAAEKSLAPKLWDTALRTTQLLILIRIPLVMVVFGVWLTRHVQQVSELLDLSLSSPTQLWAAWGFAGLTGMLVWYSARTLYAFDWRERIGRSDDWHRVGGWLPRALGALVPLTMALGYATRHPPNAADGWVWACLYLAQATLIALITWKRRPLLQAAAVWLGRNKNAWVSRLPDVGKHRHWQELGRARYWHFAGMIVLLVVSLVGWWAPETIDVVGPVALILGAAAWLVWASTAPVYWAARQRIPLLSALVAWAVAWNYVGYNDNHAVRLVAGMGSTEDPPAGLHYDDKEQARLSMEQFVAQWSAQHPAEQCPRVYLVASEGGGIRAAAWTTLVLSELEQRSAKQFWRCTLAGSGVSGGSLGLALFAAHWRDHDGVVDAKALRKIVARDFLAPVLGSAFGVDQLQRLLPVRVFPDRGQALEDAWVDAYKRDESAPDRHFNRPMPDLLRARASGQLLPALLLNTTVVASGTRLIQHPFAPMRAMAAAEPKLLRPQPPFASIFPGAIDGANWLPAELPLSSAVLNSARFSYVSPAGTVRRSLDDAHSVRTLGQLVDGGYYENSGATTLTDFMHYAIKIRPTLAERIVVIHVSNDTGVEGVMPDDADTCRPKPVSGDSRKNAGPRQAHTYGEFLSPVMALYLTREARGDQARRSLLDQTERLGPINEDGRFWHFRLCKGKRSIPLGWTIGDDTLAEMTAQLNGGAELRAKGFPGLVCKALGAACDGQQGEGAGKGE